jgi:hypothetical protein
MLELPFRQIHLDFHTSPHIPDVGVDFDPEAFVATLAAAHVDSVTVFAKCHHGYSYYPTAVGTQHPHLRRDLLGEMLAACHAAGIRAPIYTTVTWDELAWASHPEWRQVAPSGQVAGVVDSPLKPGWKNLCLNTGYADYVLAQLAEVFDRYQVDGVFVDIVRYIGNPCICATCLAEMLAHGVAPDDPAALAQFALAAERRFMARVTALVRSRQPQASLFYNSRLRMTADPQLGNRPELDNFTHLEIESLPGGFWGYDHFPLYVRAFQTFDRPLLAMVGRFHTSWGDFGGLRNRAALEFECFQALAHGAGCSIGDQLHPRGRLDAAVYKRIGAVYAEVERREPWCVETAPLPEIGVLTTNAGAGTHGALMSMSDVGSLHMLEQLKHQFQYIDSGADFSAYAVVVLPDAVAVDVALAARLREYVGAGGSLLITGESGFDEHSGTFHLADLMGVKYLGPAPYAPDYLIPDPAWDALPDEVAPVCEQQGVRLAAQAGALILARSGAPYFNRTWEHFCSHLYTPLDGVADDALVVQHGCVITIARPLFREYAETARVPHRQIVDACLRRLLPAPRVGAHSLPSTAVVTVRQQHADLIVHVLHYVPQRRGRHLDSVEDILPLHEVKLCVRTTRQPRHVRLVPQELVIDATWSDGYVCFVIPRVNGYQIVQLVDAV